MGRKRIIGYIIFCLRKIKLTKWYKKRNRFNDQI